MSIPDTFTIGVSDVPSVAFTPPRVEPGQHLVDMAVQQGLVRDPVGERGLCANGTEYGWNTRTPDAAGVPRYTVNAPALRAWVKSLPPDLEWLPIDIESNVGEFDYPSLLTTRALRAINAIILAERPDLRLAPMYQAGMLPYGSVSVDQLLALTRERAGGVASRGLTDGQSVPNGQCYVSADATFDLIDGYLDSIMATLSVRGVVNAGQSPGVWFCPRDCQTGASIPVRTMAHLGGSARRRGVKVALMWDYNSDFTRGDDHDARVQQLAAWFDVNIRPGFEAFAEAFL